MSKATHGNDCLHLDTRPHRGIWKLQYLEVCLHLFIGETIDVSLVTYLKPAAAA